MKKLLTILVISVSLVLVGCVEDPKSKDVTTSTGEPMVTVDIEGCEYFKQFGSHGERTYSHKGNCKNPIHVYNKIEK